MLGGRGVGGVGGGWVVDGREGGKDTPFLYTFGLHTVS